MINITYTNADGQSALISCSAPFVYQEIKGFETAKNTVYTTKSPQQDGETATGETLEKAERIITGVIMAGSLDLIENYRRQLITVFKPHCDGTLRFTDTGVEKVCTCKVESIVFGEKNGTTQAFDITLLCPNPFWTDIAESVDEIAVWLSGFEFPEPDGFEFPEGGMEFGERAPSLIVDVNNPGDVPCGMRIIFTAAATVVNPEVFNVDTRQYFRINKTMSAGEAIEVNTAWGQKRVTGMYNGVESNYFNYADLPGSKFMQLQPGSNPLRYNADSGLDSLNVTIRYSPQYLGV